MPLIVSRPLLQGAHGPSPTVLPELQEPDHWLRPLHPFDFLWTGHFDSSHQYIPLRTAHSLQAIKEHAQRVT